MTIALVRVSLKLVYTCMISDLTCAFASNFLWLFLICIIVHLVGGVVGVGVGCVDDVVGVSGGVGQLNSLKTSKQILRNLSVLTYAVYMQQYCTCITSERNQAHSPSKHSPRILFVMLVVMWVVLVQLV